ncbi:MAG TPA: dipeptide ABC transporter ATP-binding protein [Gammaproteobacteria bacterium]|jgi:oligopeptide/dipeptide ABC transporter ATP-binding protein|nr:peptide ABC transporter substrate-binding protein [Chromatiales bacterium]MCP4924455.1 dipeptide ABC transporter ATP-binding protein [Gammaproteobacteria bacterium]MDP7296755.1 dipeptide ABC transporter ATP-binding protein [Gammaproteobacteria bacterium]HJP38216.1 dipeptide ABC transporter ATP-binding protein [Gammaproteobacteria bacterium]
MSGQDNTALLEVRELKKFFPVRGGLLQRVVTQVRAVDGVSFKIDKGLTLGLVGESGCGKSTLGRAILRLHEPTSGQILIDGQDIVGLPRSRMGEQRRRMQIIFQDPFASLSPRRTVAQIIREPLDVHGIGTAQERERRVIELLADVGMGAEIRDRYPHEFSGGQRQRIGIARALALEPDFIVADEPVSALDVSVQSQVLNLIAELKKKRGIAFLFISHDLAVIQHVSDEIGVMYLGQIVEHATVGDLYSAPKHPYTQALMSAIPVPDPTARRTRIVLEGDVPSPMNPPAGCLFHTRCPQAQDRCRTTVPAMLNVGSETNPHRVACHLQD